MTISDIVKTFSKKEIKFLLITIVVTMIIVSVPSIYGLLTTPDHFIYTPNYNRATGDTYVYLSMIEETRQGNVTFHNLFTSEDHKPVLVNPFWLSVGFWSRTLSINPLFLIQAAKIILIPFTLSLIYITTSIFIKKRSTRMLSLLMTLGVSGFGYAYYRFFKPDIIPNVFTIKFYSTPTDIWLSEAYAMHSFYSSPHFQASICFLLLVFIFFMLGVEAANKKYIIISGILGLVLAFFHPYEIIYIYFIFAAFIFIKFLSSKKNFFEAAKKYVSFFAIMFGISIPGLLYLVYTFLSEPALSSWAFQSQTTSPKFELYLLGFGITIPLAALGIIFSLKKLDNAKIFLFTWLILTFPLLYIPLPFNRRFAEGIFIPLGILSSIGVYKIYQLIVKNKSKTIKYATIVIFAVILCASLLPTQIYNFYAFIELQRIYKMTPFYLEKTYDESFKWIKANSTSNDIVISGHTEGFLIPAFTARRVYVGHSLQTANFETKKNNMENFFKDDENPDNKKKFLKENKISLVFYGKGEKSLGSFNPERKDFLEKVFENTDVAVYKVK
ncbi:MAG: hypothetical protein ACD_63C00248G0001 [uncultured bacterium]|nr:MAG: hypothetical protein ACD_63C00248G0001 [uncultured bacterium]